MQNNKVCLSHKVRWSVVIHRSVLELHSKTEFSILLNNWSSWRIDLTVKTQLIKGLFKLHLTSPDHDWIYILGWTVPLGFLSLIKCCCRVHILLSSRQKCKTNIHRSRFPAEAKETSFIFCSSLWCSAVWSCLMHSAEICRFQPEKWKSTSWWKKRLPPPHDTFHKTGGKIPASLWLTERRFPEVKLCGFTADTQHPGFPSATHTHTHTQTNGGRIQLKSVCLKSKEVSQFWF